MQAAPTSRPTWRLSHSLVHTKYIRGAVENGPAARGRARLRVPGRVPREALPEGVAQRAAGEGLRAAPRGPLKRNTHRVGYIWILRRSVVPSLAIRANGVQFSFMSRRGSKRVKGS
jgi:hypothetical protein